MIKVTEKDYSQDNVLMQKALLETVEPSIKVDGYAGEGTLRAFKTFALIHGMPMPTGYSGEAYELIQKYVDKRFVSDDDFVQAAKTLGCKQSHIRAVADIEARGNGFLMRGRVKMLFERHKFYKYLGAAMVNVAVREAVAIAFKAKVKTAQEVLDTVAAAMPDICNPKAGGYVGDLAEHDRLDRACAIDVNAGFMSASYGMYQIMGFNHALAGYSSAKEMYIAFSESEKNQFKGFVNFIKSNPNIHKAIIAGDWLKFAAGYNGAAFATNDYNVKAAKAETKYQEYNTALA